MGLSLTHLIIFTLLVFVLFGAGKLPRVMGDIGKGIRNLREGMDGEKPEQKQEVLPPEDKKDA